MNSSSNGGSSVRSGAPARVTRLTTETTGVGSAVVGAGCSAGASVLADSLDEAFFEDFEDTEGAMLVSERGVLRSRQTNQLAERRPDYLPKNRRRPF
ncbi:exported hypothetical protein [Candidatus Microthrix parvicella RN1]|uniref:Uncharacterized protein n=1 Tax=Candidatus Neomicrothrix parvicella RN1 TaxID=1229780 RepID=R4Z1Y6_9ACTN|nr:exported hypothetical protein [Candidatus Microthrix parvicella RN1]